MIRNNNIVNNILIETRNVSAKQTYPYYRQAVHTSLVVARDNTMNEGTIKTPVSNIVFTGVFVYGGVATMSECIFCL